MYYLAVIVYFHVVPVLNISKYLRVGGERAQWDYDVLLSGTYPEVSDDVVEGDIPQGSLVAVFHTVGLINDFLTCNVQGISIVATPIPET